MAIKVKQVNEEIKDLEARCAAMREALLKINELGNCDKCGQTYVLHDIAEIKHQALSKDIGKALLERIAKLEAVAKTAKRLFEALTAKSLDKKECGVALTWLDAALAELEEDKDE